MAYFYVKESQGIRTGGGGLAKKTGAFSAMSDSDVYASIEWALLDSYPPVAGDFILCSSKHHKVHSVSNNNPIFTQSAGATYVISVSDSDCDQYLIGAIEECTGTYDHDFEGWGAHFGMHYKAGDKIYISTSGAEQYFHDCKLEMTSNDEVRVSSDGVMGVFRDCDFIYGSVGSHAITCYSGSVAKVYGGRVVSKAGGDGFVDEFFHYQSFNLGGGTVELHGVDLSIVDLNVFEYLATDEDRVDIKINGCKLHADVGWSTAAAFKTGSDTRFVAINSAATSAAAEYQYTYMSGGGRVDDETSIYRDDSLAYPSGQKVSLKVVTEADAVPGRPLMFETPTRYADLSVAGTDTIRLYILSSSTLTDEDVYAEIIYSDGTLPFKHEYSVSRAWNPLRTPSTLQTNTEAWTGRTSENRYHIDIPTTNGVAGVPYIKLYVGKPSITFYLDTSVGLV